MRFVVCIAHNPPPQAVEQDNIMTLGKWAAAHPLDVFPFLTSCSEGSFAAFEML